MIRNNGLIRAFGKADVVGTTTVAMFFIGMFVAAMLDINTALAAGIWLSVWFTMAAAPLLLTAIHYSHPAARIDNKTVKRYFALSKSDRARFPSGTTKALLNVEAPDWRETCYAVGDMIDEIERNNRETSNNGDIIKQIHDAKNDLALHTETLKELR